MLTPDGQVEQSGVRRDRDGIEPARLARRSQRAPGSRGPGGVLHEDLVGGAYGFSGGRAVAWRVTCVGASSGPRRRRGQPTRVRLPPAPRATLSAMATTDGAGRQHRALRESAGAHGSWRSVLGGIGVVSNDDVAGLRERHLTARRARSTVPEIGSTMVSERFFPRDDFFMRLALREAEQALKHGDVPIGAVDRPER